MSRPKREMSPEERAYLDNRGKAVGKAFGLLGSLFLGTKPKETIRAMADDVAEQVEQHVGERRLLNDPNTITVQAESIEDEDTEPGGRPPR